MSDVAQREKCRNQELHDALLIYAQTAIDVLSVRLPQGDQLPFLQDSEWVAESAHVLMRKPRYKPIWPIFIVRSRKSLESLTEHQKCLKLLREDPTVGGQLDRLIGTRGQMMRINADDLLDRFLASILPDKLQVVFDEVAFDREYTRLESAFYNPAISFQALAPLHGFKADGSVVPLEEGLRIEKMTIEETARCIGAGLIHIGPSEDMIFNPPQFAIKMQYEEPKVVGGDLRTEVSEEAVRKWQQEEQEIEDRMAQVLRALRLFKAGICSYSGVVHSPDNWLISYSSLRGRIHSLPSPWIGGYVVKESENESLRSFWKDLQTREVRDRKFLDMAIQRFSYANERYRPEDQIVDLMIAAESLFLCDVSEDRGELPYRLALRAGLFIGGNVQEQKEIYLAHLVFKRTKRFTVAP